MDILDPKLFRYIWRHSRDEQLFILALIIVQLPFYWASLDIPKRIVNEAIQGSAFKGGQETALLFHWVVNLPDFLGGNVTLFPGISLTQLPYLMVLSVTFLVLTLINGFFKYVINIRKGMLGERMLRRMRFDLFTLLLRFRPEDIRGVKPAEAASMIKDEVEPIGGFIGDALIQPAFLGTQALTAVLFILVQSFWLGIVAVLVVAIQAVVVPYLRREQLRLGRERQVASRQLAGRIGEVVEGVPVVHTHGVRPYSQAEISDRLAHLFNIRVKLYNRKFAVKFLNNLLAQTTPFFFYAVGGYLALKGSLDIGQLVAVIAAYRDLPPPIKDLIDWDQERNDVTVKYEQVVAQFSPKRMLKGTSPDDGPEIAADAPFVIDGLRVMEGRGSVVLETMSAVIERPAHVALLGSNAVGRDILAKVLARHVTAYQGSVTLGGRELAKMPSETLGRLIGYASPEPNLFLGSIRDNVLLALHRCEPRSTRSAQNERKWHREEALRTGNIPFSATEDWIDYAAAGISGPAELDRAIVAALDLAGASEEIYRLGLEGRLRDQRDARVLDLIVAARRSIRDRLGEKGLSRLVETFDPARYNTNATIGENLIFGLALDPRFAPSRLAGDPYIRSILDAEALLEPLTEMGLSIAETMIEIFGGMSIGGSVFERFSFIRASEIESYQRMLEAVRENGRSQITEEWRVKLIALSFGYIETRHRLSLIDEPFQERILRARASFRQFLPRQYTDLIEFYDPDRVMRAAPLRDNLLFGRISYGVPNAERKVSAVLRTTIEGTEVEELVYQLGLDFEVGIGGRDLGSYMRQAIDLARSLIKRPQILILDGVPSGLNAMETKAMMSRLRQEFSGRSLIATLNDPAEAKTYDLTLTFDGNQLVSIGKNTGQDAVASVIATPSIPDIVREELIKAEAGS